MNFYIFLEQCFLYCLNCIHINQIIIDFTNGLSILGELSFTLIPFKISSLHHSIFKIFYLCLKSKILHIPCVVLL